MKLHLVFYLPFFLSEGGCIDFNVATLIVDTIEPLSSKFATVKSTIDTPNSSNTVLLFLNSYEDDKSK